MTIRRNSWKAKYILDSAKNVKCFTITNGFLGEPMCERPQFYRNGEMHSTTPSGYLKAIYEMFRHAKLTCDAPNRFCLSVTSNEWYKFEALGRIGWNRVAYDIAKGLNTGN